MRGGEDCAGLEYTSEEVAGKQAMRGSGLGIARLRYIHRVEGNTSISNCLLYRKNWFSPQKSVCVSLVSNSALGTDIDLITTLSALIVVTGLALLRDE